MAQIDLKYAIINVTDGYALAGLVNKGSGLAAGALAAGLTSASTPVGTGDTFTISGESGTPTHTITSHIETAGSTTSVVFSTAVASGGVTNGSSITLTKTGAVNNVAGYTAGGTTILVDGFVGLVAAGDTFTIAAETGSPSHTVVSQIATSGNTTSITFSTVLATGGVADDAVITLNRTGITLNAPGGYVAGTTTMVVDGFTTAVELYDPFTISTETGTPVHTITAHTETGMATTSITFTPALSSTVSDDDVIAVGPHSFTITIGDGTLQYTEHRNMEYKLNQGLLKYVRLGDQAPMDVSFDLVWEFLTAQSGDVVPTVEDVLKQRGLAANWISTDPDLCQPFALNLEILYYPPCPGEYMEVITLAKFRWEELDHDAKAATVSVKGKCATFEAADIRQVQPPGGYNPYANQ